MLQRSGVVEFAQALPRVPPGEASVQAAGSADVERVFACVHHSIAVCNVLVPDRSGANPYSSATTHKTATPRLGFALVPSRADWEGGAAGRNEEWVAQPGSII